MTVELQVPITIAAVTVDGQTVFNFAFQANDIGDLYATYVAIDGTRTEFVGGVDFTATGLGNPNGGAITLTSFTGTEDGQNFVIYREIAIERENDYSRDLLSDELNREQNRIFQILQDMSRRIDNALSVPPGETPPSINSIFAAAAAAAQSAAAAADSVDAAAGYAGNASSAANASVSAAALSASFANAPEDSPVSPGNFSSFHWSRKARLWAMAPENQPVAPGEFSAFHWAMKAAETVASGIADGSVTLVKLAPEVVDLIESNVRFLASGAALPAEDIGPIWHEDYGSVLTWQVFNANGANYTGYASEQIGMQFDDGQPTARRGFVKKNGASLSKVDFAALWNWALHVGRTVALGSWTDGAFVFADNGNGTFKLPNTRGRFRREFSDGFSLDSGRVFGSAQADENKPHLHGSNALNFVGNALPGHSHTVPIRNSTLGGTSAITADSTTPNTSTATSSVSAGTPTGNVTGTTDSAGSVESRPANTSFLGVLKF